MIYTNYFTHVNNCIGTILSLPQAISVIQNIFENELHNHCNYFLSIEINATSTTQEPYRLFK